LGRGYSTSSGATPPLLPVELGLRSGRWAAEMPLSFANGFP
jgi:hypothetical protein